MARRPANCRRSWLRGFPCPSTGANLHRSWCSGTGTTSNSRCGARTTAWLVAVHSTASYDKESNSVFGVVHDISERRKLLDRISRRAKAGFGSCSVEHAPTAIFVQSATGSTGSF